MNRIALPRRQFLQATTSAALLGAAATTLPIVAARAALIPTPRQAEGPFYPLTLPLDKDNDLANVEGQSGEPVGTITHVIGRVTDTDGRPQAGALVEIWQVNGYGRYHHPGDNTEAPLDPAFQGYGQTVTDAVGAYRFRTVRPVPYPGRTPHIHFAIKPPQAPRFITQMYIADEPGNERDGLLRRISDPEQRARIIVPLAPAPPDVETGALLGTFDIVLGA